MAGTWQMLQLKPGPFGIWEKSCRPAAMSAAKRWSCCIPASCGGAFVARMKVAKVTMSFSGSSPQLTVSSSSQACWSDTVSKDVTGRPSVVFSTGIKKLVMPISFRYASPANVSKLGI